LFKGFHFCRLTLKGLLQIYFLDSPTVGREAKNPTFRRLMIKELEYTVFYKEKKKNTTLKLL